MVTILYKMMARKKKALKEWVNRKDIEEIKSLVPLKGIEISKIVHDSYFNHLREVDQLDEPEEDTNHAAVNYQEQSMDTVQ